MPLTPFNELTFEVSLCTFQCMNIDMRLDDTGDQEIAGEVVILIHVDSPDHSFESIAEQGTLLIGMAECTTVEFDQFIKAEPPGELVQVRPAYDLRSHLGKEPLVFIGI